MPVQIQFRRDTAANWTSNDPTLASGELGYESDTGQMKIGDGSTAWTSLGYTGVTSSYVDNAVNNLVDTAPDALNTLNELAAALNDDADFSNTIATSIATKAPLNQTISTKNSNYQLQASDNGAIIKVDGTVTITIPSSTIPAGGRVDFVNVGSGTVTFAGSGVTISSKDSALTITTQYSAASLISDSTTTALLVGDLG